MSRYLIPAMHDVTSTNWLTRRVLLSALDEVVCVPKSLLIIPNLYCGSTVRQNERFCRVMSERLTEGDELVLHGYAHLDDQPPGGPIDQLIRTRYTAGEREFSTIPLVVARARIQAGATWFAANGWPLHDFIAPAWLMNPTTWEVLDGLSLRYTTTLQRSYLLHPRRLLKAPCLTYSVRSPACRLVSRYYLRWLVQRYAEASLPCLDLHPVDAAHPDVIRYWQELPAVRLETRTPVTKNGFAQAFAQAWMGGSETTVAGQAQTLY